MRIHTKLTYREVRGLLWQSGARNVDTEILAEHGSRTHERAFEVALSGTGGRPGFGHGDWQAATWDEWGAFLGALFDADPQARAGGSVKRPVYRDRDHFHFLTGDRFQRRYNIAGQPTYLPEDTHKRHHWKFQWDKGFDCTKCSATRPSWNAVDAYAPRAYDTQEA
jgi:hypothetical protein